MFDIPQDIIGNDQEWMTHHRGLQQLVQLNGMLQVESNEILRLTISWYVCSSRILHRSLEHVLTAILPHRCELRGVHLLDQPPTFSLPRQWLRYATPLQQPELESTCRGYLNHLDRIWADGGLGGSEWHKLYVDLVLFSIQSFQEAAEIKTVDSMAADFGAWSNPMIHRLLSWRPAYGIATRESTILETCRLGALLYLVPAWRFFGVAPVISRNLVRNLKAVLINYDANWSSVWLLKLWSLYMGGVEAQDLEEADWYVTHIVETLVENGVRHWHEAIRHIRKIMWFECLFVGRDDVLAKKVSAMLG